MRHRFIIGTSNDMMKLRNLDLIFNFCLVIDKTLELAENNGAAVDDILL